MVDRALSDGTRIAQLLASEITGREAGPFAHAAVTDADPDVEATPDGARAYDVIDENQRVASVFVLPERVRVDIVAGLDAAKHAADDANLRARLRPSTPPALLVFVEDGAEVKRVLPVVRAALDAAR